MNRLRAGKTIVATVFLTFCGIHPAQAGSILREVWQGIGGTAISQLTSDPNYPNNPSSTNYVTTGFEAPAEFGDNYGQRMHGYVIPPTTGDYVFWIASDDGGELWLSTDESPANRKLIANVNGWTASREWTREANQQSAPIRLEADKAYYIAALQKEGGGGDNLAVRWLRPDAMDQGPIPADYLYPWGTAFAAPRIIEQPGNATAVEGEIARFTVRMDPLTPAATQWRRNGVSLAGATSSTLEYGPVTMVDHQARFMAVLTNRLGSTNSAQAILTVSPDVTPPTLASALNLGVQNTVQVTFSEPVEVATATNPGNYKFNNGVTAIGATMGSDTRNVLLTTSPLSYGTSYTVTVSNVRDRAFTPNTISANSTISFTAVEYAPIDIGAVSGGNTVNVPGGFDVTGKGLDLGGTTDEFQFGYQEKSGDFDIQVRLEGLQITDGWVQAGLIARESLNANAPFAGVFSSSAELGCFFESRSTAGARSSLAAPTGGFPVNYPEMYLRLRRVGNSFTGFAGFDGKTWQQLGSLTITLPAKLFFGMAVSSHNKDLPATARFRDLKPVTAPGTFTYVPANEPLGPSNRRTGLVFSEIMYNPAPRQDTNSLEYIEIYNAESVFVDLGGWKLAGGITYTFPEGVRIYPGGFLLVAADPAAIQSIYGVSGALGPYSGRLNNGGDNLQLLNRAGAVRLDVEYDSKAPWPVSADGAGHSLVLARPSYGEDDPRAWSASARVGGSPGEVEAIWPNPWAGGLINEFLAHTDDPVLDFIELYNASNASVDLNGCYLTDDPSTNKFRIENAPLLAARGFLSFDQAQLGFALSSAGETIYLLSADGSRVLDAIRFEGQENGVSSGRAPDGSPTIRRLQSPTAGSANSSWKVEDVVINEVMYHPISNDDADQYIELHNRSGASVDLSEWQFVSGVDFQFPTGANIPPGGYVVVGKSRERLLQNYTQLNTNNTFGDFGGRLSRSGEHLALARRDFVQSTNELGQEVTERIYITVSEVTYVDGGRWPELADGGGSSLELIDPRADTLRPTNWRASDESNKAPWKTIETTATLDHGNGQYPANRLYISLLGAGECLVDDVEVLRVGSTNVVSNAGFESGTAGWTFFGNHSRTTVDTEGALSGTRVLHVRAPGDGDTANNTIRANLASSLASGNTVTIRAKVRWLAGWPEILFRLRGNWIELAGRMDVPTNLGTPGAANSRRVSNAGPAIFDVTHSPALPRANQAVVVTARVTDPDGVAAPRLRWRVDSSSTLTSTTMRDDGLAGDALAGDGLYSATINGRAAGNIVAFRVEASDDAATSASSVFPADAPARECLIRWDDAIPFGTFEHHHLWNTAATESAFNSAPPLNNTWRDATLVYGNSRVIYNAAFRHKGSPYHGGGGDIAATVPKDDLLLGIDDRVYGSTGNGGSENTGMKGDVSAWIGEQLGIPFLHSHYIRMYRNGSQFREILYDLEQPNRYMAESWFGGGDVNDTLYKIAVWFEFDDNNSGFAATGATMERFLSGGNYKLARYRWNWQIRPDGNTANDYSSIFNLVSAVNSTTERLTRLPQLADMEEWMRVFAYHRILGNWDSYAFSVGQNMYLYTPLGHQAKLIPWDVDFVLGEGAGATDALWGGQDPRINELFTLPLYRRMLWRAYMDAVNGPLLAQAYGPQVDGRRAALLKNGVNLADPNGIKSYIEARRNYIRNQLQSQDAQRFEITSNSGNDFTATSPMVQISGTAPFAVAAIEVNGVPYAITWTGFTSWRIDVPMGAETNILEIAGRDLRGNIIPGAADTITVRYTGALPQAQDWIVINEIMYNASAADADYIELHNRHSSFSFDLSGLELSGVDFTFPAGTFIPAGGYLVVVENRAAFAAAYGPNISVLGPYIGNLQNNGETLRLVKRGATAAEDVVIDDLRYENILPWDPRAAGFGSSLQLTDPAQDNYRVGNWSATATNDVNRTTPGRANSTRTTLPSFPLVWLNEVLPNNRTGAQDNFGQREPWIELYNSGAVSVDLSGFFLSDDPANLTRWQFPVATAIQPGEFLVIWADGQTEQAATGALHTNFRLNSTNGIVLFSRAQANGSAAMDYIRYAVSSPDHAFGSYPDGEPRRRRLLYTPTSGARNDPTIPNLLVSINEWMASNSSTLADPADGHFEDWFELFNAGPTSIDLSGFYLTDSQARPTLSRIPLGTVIPAGGFLLVWADNEPTQNGPGRDLHVNFGLNNQGEEIALFNPDEQLVSLVSFGPQTSNISQGRFPDGSEPPFLSFSLPTPSAPNVSEFANQPPSVSLISDKEINEGAALQFIVAASDPDPGQSLTFTLVNSPAGAVINAQTGAFSWTPSEADGPGLFTLSVRVQDNGTPARAVTRSFRVNVAEVNVAPLLSSIPNVTIDEGSLTSLNVTASDPDLPGQPLSFSLEGAVPAGASIDQATGEFAWTPEEGQGPAVYDFTVRVRDSEGLSAVAPIRISVREINNKPLIQEIGPRSVDEEALFTLQILAQDTDTPPVQLTYSLLTAPSGATIDAATGLLRWTPSESDGPRDHNFTVVVSEPGGTPNATTSFLVGVREVNKPPVLQPYNLLTALPGQNLSIPAQVSDADLPSQTLSFTAISALPAGAALDSRTGIFSWIIPEDPQTGRHEITIRVTDDGPGGLSAEQKLTVDVQGALRVAINEILHRPSLANAEFVELHNYSTLNTIDLGGWRLVGYDYTFPAGTLLPPGGFLCVARNVPAFQAAYGDGPLVLGPAANSLPADGGLVRLMRPRGQTLPDEVIDEVAFSLSAPWPPAAATQGASLQLLDPREDHRRPANWGSSVGNRTNTPVTLKTITNDWRYAQTFPGAAWNTPSFVDTSWPSSNALFYVETASLAAPKNTPLTLGSTAYYFRTKFDFTGSTNGAVLNLNIMIDDGAVFYLNGEELFRHGMAEGPVANDTFANRVVGDASYEAITAIPARGLRQGENVLAVEVHQNGSGSSDIVFGAAIDLVSVSAASFTPGAQNSVATDLPPFEPLWINEVLPNNTTGLRDNAGDLDPWVELYNAGTTPISLDGWYLTDNFSFLTKWLFPPGQIVPAGGYMLVWADAEPLETAPGQPHTTFRLNATSGSVALVRMQSGSPVVVDYLKYAVSAPDQSFGSSSDGNPYGREILLAPTPAQRNGLVEPTAPTVAVTLLAQAVRLNWATTAGFSYRLQAADAVTGAQWTTIHQVSGNGSQQGFTDSIPPGKTARYYRVLVQ